MGRPDFPRTFKEFQDRFSTEEACRHFLVESRWPEGYVCSRCGCRRGYPVTRNDLLECSACHYQVSATAGTVMHRSRTALRDWFCAAYLVTTHTPGFSALQLQRQLGLNRYETAWTMLHKLRRAMVRPERDRIAAPVEVDETYVGGREEGRKGGRQRDSTKAIVVAAVEVRGHGSGRIRLALVDDVSAAALVGFVRSAVVPGSTVLTDGWSGYAPLQAEGYDHRPKTQGEGKNAASILPRVHRVFGNLKTWIAGTHHGISRKHLPYYLNEFVFRFNRRRTPMAAFQSLLGLTTQHAPTTYKMLYAPESTG